MWLLSCQTRRTAVRRNKVILAARKAHESLFSISRHFAQKLLREIKNRLLFSRSELLIHNLLILK